MNEDQKWREMMDELASGTDDEEMEILGGRLEMELEAQG